MSGFPVEFVDAKGTAKAVRAALRAAFPTSGVSVRMAHGSAHGWLTVAWVDGPTADQVEAVTFPFQSSQFDGMDDGYHSIEPTLYVKAGEELPVLIRYACRGITQQRAFSVEAMDRARNELAARDASPWWWATTDDQWRAARGAPTYYAWDDRVRAMLSGCDLQPSARSNAGTSAFRGRDDTNVH